jgi:phage terminase large subunit
MSALQTQIPKVDLRVPRIYGYLFERSRYKVAWGGRGSGKSWAIARVLIARAYTEKLRILCVREFQSSIADSVLRLLADQIQSHGLLPFFDIQKTSIVCKTTGSEFIFKGLRHNVQEIKSLEGVDAVWCEESQSVSEESWQVLIPTIRKDGSEFYISFNPYLETDPTYKRFILNEQFTARYGRFVVKTGWKDNPGFPRELDEERRFMLATDPDAYEWVYGGHCLTVSEAIIFRGRTWVEAFDTPEDARFFHGCDWGFSQDPTVLIRCFIKDETLYIDQEAWGVGVELDHLPSFFDRVPTARDWPVFADNSRPETISYMNRHGFPGVKPADKWPGCVEDGIAHLKGFKRIVIHERCPHTAQEFRLYSFKKDARTGDVLPVVLGKNDHAPDAVRYSLNGFIQSRGVGNIWARLAD